MTNDNTLEQPKAKRHTKLALAPLLYTTEAGASLLGFHNESIRRAIREGRIHAVRCGRLWRIPATEIQRIATEGL